VVFYSDGYECNIDVDGRSVTVTVIAMESSILDQRCHSSITVVSQLCHRDVTVVSQWCDSGFTLLIHCCHIVVTQWLQCGHLFDCGLQIVFHRGHSSTTKTLL
jgi:Na+/pantothenate symporter